MKITILTFSKEDNNGANLQCYALYKILCEWGHSVDILDIQLAPLEMSFLSKIVRIKNHFNYISFRKRHLNCFTKKYESLGELVNNPPKSDLFIVGSDQVWNPEITKRLDPLIYFFSFLPDGTKRISYAASFGIGQWVNEDIKDDVRLLLSKFNAISVREDSGVEICNKTFEVDAKMVCDPTLLLDSYEEICGKYDSRKETNQLMYFKFVRNAAVRDFITDNAKRYNYRVIALGEFRYFKDGIYRPFYKLEDWLNTIRYSKCIVTDSFHCTVFCILFKKKFIALPGRSDRLSRINSLLDTLGLSNRFCLDLNELQTKFEYLINADINYNEVDVKKEIFKRQSLEFLKQALLM